jgi:PII-like signaling protein
MLNPGPAKKVTIYVAEDHQYRGHALYMAILDRLFSSGVSGASAFRGIAGFGSHHKMHTARILDLTVNLPVKIEFIESAEKVDEILRELREMVGTGVMEVQDTLVIKSDHAAGARS